MVHPGIIVASVFGVVVTGVVIYTIIKEEIHDFLESFEKPSGVPYGYEQTRDHGERQQHREHGFAQDDYDFEHGHGQSSSMYMADYELRHRRSRRLSEDDENDNEKDSEHDALTERLRRLNETQRTIAADEARVAEMGRSMREREEALQRSMLEQEERLERELRESKERNARREQELAQIRQQQQQLQMPQLSEIYQNPFASSEPLIPDRDDDGIQQRDIQTTNNHSTPTTEEVSSRTAHAILRHNLSSNYQENVNPFEDPSALLENTSSLSTRSSVAGEDDGVDAFADAEDRSITVGREDEDEEEDLDWTEAEIGSIGSHDSDESWVSH